MEDEWRAGKWRRYFITDWCTGLVCDEFAGARHLKWKLAHVPPAICGTRAASKHKSLEESTSALIWTNGAGRHEHREAGAAQGEPRHGSDVPLARCSRARHRLAESCNKHDNQAYYGRSLPSPSCITKPCTLERG